MCLNVSDILKLITACVPVFVRAVNTLLVTRPREDKSFPFPPKGVLYRGGGLPAEHKDFYQVGKSFRVAGFLAASFSKIVAEKFMVLADGSKEQCVIWEIRLDPRGEHSHVYKCKHVSYVRYSNLEHEMEYLFAPYSPFTVKEVSNSLCLTD
jgi:hypothetical protein